MVGTLSTVFLLPVMKMQCLVLQLSPCNHEATSTGMKSQHIMAGGAEREKGLESSQASLCHWKNTKTFYPQTSCEVNIKGPYD